MKKLLVLILSSTIFLTGCGGEYVAINPMSSIPNGYNTNSTYTEEKGTQRANQLINQKYEDNKVHIFADEEAYLMVYQCPDFCDRNPEKKYKEYEFATNQNSEFNAFYELILYNPKYPENYEEFIAPKPEAKYDNKKIEVEVEEVDFSLTTEEFQNTLNEVDTTNK